VHNIHIDFDNIEPVIVHNMYVTKLLLTKSSILVMNLCDCVRFLIVVHNINSQIPSCNHCSVFVFDTHKSIHRFIK